MAKYCRCGEELFGIHLVEGLCSTCYTLSRRFSEEQDMRVDRAKAKIEKGECDTEDNVKAIVDRVIDDIT